MNLGRSHPVASFLEIYMYRSTHRHKNEYYIVHVDAPPLGGKANKRLIEILAGYFGVKKSNITIVKGMRSREKLVEIIGVD